MHEARAKCAFFSQNAQDKCFSGQRLYILNNCDIFAPSSWRVLTFTDKLYFLKCIKLPSYIHLFGRTNVIFHQDYCHQKTLRIKEFTAVFIKNRPSKSLRLYKMANWRFSDRSPSLMLTFLINLSLLFLPSMESFTDRRYQEYMCRVYTFID